MPWSERCATILRDSCIQLNHRQANRTHRSTSERAANPFAVNDGEVVNAQKPAGNTDPWLAALRRSWIARLGIAYLLLGVLLSGTRAAVLVDESDGEGEEPAFIGGAYSLEDVLGLVPGEVAFSYVDSEGEETSFTALATDLSEYPGSLELDETPFGPAALLAGTNPGDAPFYFYAPSVGVLAPLDTTDLLSYSGPLGTGTLTVSMQAVQQGQAGTRVGLGGTLRARSAS